MLETYISNTASFTIMQKPPLRDVTFIFCPVTKSYIRPFSCQSKTKLTRNCWVALLAVFSRIYIAFSGCTLGRRLHPSANRHMLKIWQAVVHLSVKRTLGSWYSSNKSNWSIYTYFGSYEAECKIWEIQVQDFLLLSVILPLIEMASVNRSSSSPLWSLNTLLDQ